MTVSAAAAAAVVDRLWAAGCVAADEEAVELVDGAPDDATLEAWVRRREQGEPLAWITGWMSFCGRVLRVDPGVYVPRHQTEDLARRAATVLGRAVRDAGHTARPGGPGGPGGAGDPGGPVRAADLCTGAGAVAAHLAAEVPGTVVVGVDVDPGAFRCARRNGVAAVAGDLDGPLRSHAFDVVTAVAPYVPTGEIGFLPADVQTYEPRRALDGGDDGLAVVRRLVTGAARLLRPGGWLLTEVGADQDARLGPDLAAAGYADVTPWHDEDGDLRGLAARLVADV